MFGRRDRVRPPGPCSAPGSLFGRRVRDGPQTVTAARSVTKVATHAPSDSYGRSEPPLRHPGRPRQVPHAHRRCGGPAPELPRPVLRPYKSTGASPAGFRGPGAFHAAPGRGGRAPHDAARFAPAPAHSGVSRAGPIHDPAAARHDPAGPRVSAISEPGARSRDDVCRSGRPATPQRSAPERRPSP